MSLAMKIILAVLGVVFLLATAIGIATFIVAIVYLETGQIITENDEEDGQDTNDTRRD